MRGRRVPRPTGLASWIIVPIIVAILATSLWIGYDMMFQAPAVKKADATNQTKQVAPVGSPMVVTKVPKDDQTLGENIFRWFLLIVLAGTVVAFFGMAWKQYCEPRITKRPDGTEHIDIPLPEHAKAQMLRDPMVVTLVSLFAIHMVCLIVMYDFWTGAMGTLINFLTVNLAILVIAYLQRKGAVGRTTSIFLGIVIGVILVKNLRELAEEKSLASANGGITSKTVTTNQSHGVPVDIALPIIADCESGDGSPGSGKQFNEDGTLVQNPKSTAVGKYQIMASLHEERAKAMGLDIRTEEGNEKYARILYEEFGTKDWEADPKSQACWEPRLKAYTWPGGEAVVIVVKAPTSGWSHKIQTPYKPKRWRIENPENVRVLWNEGKDDETEEDLPRPEGVENKRPKVVYSFRLRSNGDSASDFRVKFF